MLKLLILNYFSWVTGDLKCFEGIGGFKIKKSALDRIPSLTIGDTRPCVGNFILDFSFKGVMSLLF